MAMSAASASSRGDTSFLAASSARPRPSYRAYSARFMGVALLGFECDAVARPARSDHRRIAGGRTKANLPIGGSAMRRLRQPPRSAATVEVAALKRLADALR